MSFNINQSSELIPGHEEAVNGLIDIQSHNQSQSPFLEIHEASVANSQNQPEFQVVSQHPKQKVTKIWKEQDINKLFTLYHQYGSRWAIISKIMNMKPENSLKNKFNCSIRKFTRKLNKINRQMHTQFRKEIRAQSIFRIIEATKLFPNMSEHMKKLSIQIRKKILSEAGKQQLESSKEIVNLINEINGFNLKTRSHKNPKHKLKSKKQQIPIDFPKQIIDRRPSRQQVIKRISQVMEEQAKQDSHTQNIFRTIPDVLNPTHHVFTNALEEAEPSQSHLTIPLHHHNMMGSGDNSCCWGSFFNLPHRCEHGDEWFHQR